MRLIVLVAVLAAVAAVFLQHRAQANSERRLAAVAAEIARRDVSVHCQGLFGAALDVGVEAGSVEFDAHGLPVDETRLKRPVCQALDRFQEDGVIDFEAVQAIHTLTHESWHLAGVQDEATTECYALQTTGPVAERLGASPAQGRAIARIALEQLYPSLPDRYRTQACRDGGPLDLHPGSPVWP